MLVRHLYLHVPFCLRRCSYCDFAVQPTRRPEVDAWLEAVSRELALLRRADAALDLQLETIYVGGGTPSLLGVGAMKTLRGIIEQHAVVERDVEWTAEANPENLTRELADDWLRAGVNRLSIGIQTFHGPALKWMGRLHGPEGAAAAVGAARAAGFGNINVDLIFALPESLERDWEADLAGAIALEPQHISLYGLTAEPTAALGRWVREGRATLPPEEVYSTEYQLAAETLTRAGFEHYEVSNFAKPGRESAHNRAYWNGSAYLGVGPSAHSYLPPRRFWNVRGWKAYRELLERAESPQEGSEILDLSAYELERIWLELRTSRGLVLTEATAKQRAALQQWQTSGWAEVADGRIRLRPAGWLLLDQLAVELAGA